MAWAASWAGGRGGHFDGPGAVNLENHRNNGILMFLDVLDDSTSILVRNEKFHF